MNVHRWYDRHARTWVIQTRTADGCPVGDSDFAGTREGAEAFEAERVAALPRLRPEVRVRLRSVDEPSVLTTWGELVDANQDGGSPAPFLEAAEEELLAGRRFIGGGGAAPVFVLELEPAGS